MSAIHHATHHEPLHVTKPQVARPDGGRRLAGDSTAARVFASADCVDRLFHAGNQDGAASVFDLATAKAVYAALLGGPPQTDSSYDVG
jgi:hypothetical protein